MQTGSMVVGARSTHSCEINVTPLIDVLLVLLIIFMVILPEHKWGEKTLVPQPSMERVEKNPLPPIVIQLRDVGESKRPLLTINQEEVSWDSLEDGLTAAFKLRVDRVAFVIGDPEVDFEYVAQAVDITHHAGADRIGLIGKKD
ncbi:MAG: outer rane transport energization protein ExbD [Candidatus Angelobacter sp.]|nr:outer rane transport energization protein ExbD [Candidatus Angelobacter sp.]